MKHLSAVVLVLAVVVLVAASAGAAGKTLVSSFEKPAEAQRVAGLEAEQVVGIASQGKASLRVTFTPEQKSLDLSGLLPADWRGYDYLRIDLYNPGPPLIFTLRVDDALYDPEDPEEKHTISSWYHRARTGWSTLEFAVPGFAEGADLSQIKQVWLRCESPLRQPATVFIDNVRFVRGGGPLAYRPPKRRPRWAAHEVPGNLIPNGNFELGLQGWGSWGRWDGGRYRFGSGFGKDAYEGESSAAIISDVPGRGGIFTEVLRQVRPGLHRLSFAVKATDGAVPRVLLQGGSVNADRTIPGLPPRWRNFTYHVTVPAKAENLRLYIFNVGAGTLFTDAVSLVSLTGAATPQPAVSRVPQKPAHVEINKNVIYLNDEPFFPVGIYGVYDPAALQDTGFNLMMGSELMPTSVQLLDAAAEAGLMTMFNLTGLLRGHRPEKVRQAVEAVKKHPAILAWYLVDEPDHGAWNVPPDELALATRLLRRSTSQPTTTVVMPWAESNLYRYQGAVDILATDVYPIRGGGQPSDLTRVARVTDLAKRATGGKKPVWLVLQATPKASPAEEYGVTYLALTHGADGILYFAYGDKLRSSEAWAALVDISLELRELAPYLTSPNSEEEVTVSNEGIHWTLKESPKLYSLITVNGTSETIEDVTLSLPFAREGARFIVPFEARVAEIKDGSITDDYGPYQRHVYVIEK